MSAELPSPEWLAQARAWLAEVGDHDNHDHPHPNDVARLLAALDAEKARAQTAEAERDKLRVMVDEMTGQSAGDDAYIIGLERRVALADAITANNATTAELLARAQAAEDALAAELSARNLSGEVLQRCDAVLNGPTPETHWRSLHDVDVQVAALLARAKTAEDALAALRTNPPDTGEVTRRAIEERDDARAERDEARDALARLREVAASVERRIVYSDTSRCWYLAADPGQPALGALREALAATPTDLAAGSRREWKAQGMEMVVSNLAVPMRDSALGEGGGDAARYLDDLIADIATDAAALRGER